jgi:hypothetical protein
LNRPRVTDNGALYVQVDDEWLWPLDEPDERYAYIPLPRAISPVTCCYRSQVVPVAETDL